VLFSLAKKWFITGVLIWHVSSYYQVDFFSLNVYQALASLQE
jgi:hypothetical protein